LADFVKQGGVSPELARNQRHQKENFDRNVPPMMRDGVHAGTENQDTKEKEITVGPGVTTVVHGLGRVPKGWFTHSHKGDAHSIVEYSRDDKELKLQNVYVGSTNTTCKLWIW
jgi:hypothetical protein